MPVQTFCARTVPVAGCLYDSVLALQATLRSSRDRRLRRCKGGRGAGARKWEGVVPPKMAGELPTSRDMTTSAGASHGLVKTYGMSAPIAQVQRQGIESP